MVAGLVLGGRYRLDEPIRFDTEADVWRAVDTEVGRTVGVRLPNKYVRATALRSFQDQFHLLSMIDHPGVISVYDLGVDPSVLVYLVIDHVETEYPGRDGPPTPEATMELVAQAADALHAVHATGYVYRNIRKGLLLRGGTTVVLDGFHLACPVGSPQLHHVVTTDSALDRPATALTDIYDLGLVAYGALTGGRRGPGLGSSLDDLSWPSSVPPAVRAVVDRATAVNPAQRWPTAAALADAARRALP